MTFTFSARRAEKIHGRTGFAYEAKRDGVVVAAGWTAGTKQDALHQARIDAEPYGFIDE